MATAAVGALVLAGLDVLELRADGTPATFGELSRQPLWVAAGGAISLLLSCASLRWMRRHQARHGGVTWSVGALGFGLLTAVTGSLRQSVQWLGGWSLDAFLDPRLLPDVLMTVVLLLPVYLWSGWVFGWFFGRLSRRDAA